MGKEPTYRQALHHAWRMIWDHKILWPLGLFAAFLGQLGLVDFSTKFISALQQRDAAESWGNLPHMLSSVFSVLSQIHLPIDKWVWAVWMWVILIGLFLVFLFIAIVSQGALIHSTSQKIRTGKHPDVSKAWHESVTHFGRLLLVHVIRKFVILVLTVLIGMGTISAVQSISPVSTLALVVLLLVSVTIGFILSCLSIYTIGYILVEEYHLGQALKAAWALFKDHLLVSFEIGFIVIVGNIVTAILAVVGAAVFLSPVFLLWLFSGLIVDSYVWFLVGASSVLIFIVYIIILGSFFAIFSTSLWTHLFMKMHKHGIESRMIHHITQFLKLKSKNV